MKISPVAAQLFRADGQTPDGRTDRRTDGRTERRTRRSSTVAFRSFANAPKNMTEYLWYY